MRKTYENTYFKDQSPDRPLMSGLALPKDPDGAVRGKTFVRCDFHPNCGAVRFEDCVFEGCEGVEYLRDNLNSVERP